MWSRERNPTALTVKWGNPEERQLYLSYELRNYGRGSRGRRDRTKPNIIITSLCPSPASWDTVLFFFKVYWKK